MFNEIRDQSMDNRIRIRKGAMQDASFIESDRSEDGKLRGKDGGTSLCIHEGDIQICTHNGHNSAEGGGQDIFHGHVLKS